ncbi:MAG TPA: APC family permease [Verrucomicrobiae bacterium]|jgi:amino acid transporter|nr:APC family permease [Verrucomicrobiae bacterium]
MAETPFTTSDVPATHLKANALSLSDAIVLGLASSAPAQTMAVALPALVATVGYAGLLPILAAFAPMLGIAIGYQRLNRWDQSSGATYSWVSKALHPYLGFLAGWMILIYYTLGTISMTVPAGAYTLQLLAPGLVESKAAVAMIGAVWNVLVTLLLLVGIQIAARFQKALAVFEYTVLFLFVILGMRALASGHAASKVTSEWFTLSGAGGARGFLAGTLIAVFMYSGWDAAIYVNEETKDKENNPGRAAIGSVIILLTVYCLITFSYQGIVSRSALENSAGNSLAVIAEHLLPGRSSLILSLIVLLGTVACLQVAVVSSSRLGFAMAEDRVMPGFFKILHPKTGSPWAVTLFMGGVNLMFLLLTVFEAGGVREVLANIAGALGIIASLFYALTAIAAVWQYRGVLLRNFGNFILGGVWPGLGAISLLAVVVESVRTRAVSPTVLWAGLGAAAVALPIAVGIHYIGNVPLLSAPSPRQRES